MKKLIVFALTLTGAASLWADVVLVEDGAPRAAIYVPPEVMKEDRPVDRATPFAERTAELQRRKLRDGVRDLSHYLGQISGAKVEVHERLPNEGEGLQQVLIGNYARERFGPPKVKARFQQGWRLTVKEGVLGLQGESDEAASYAIYEVLDRLGCRWFLPGPMGEHLPALKTIRFADEDTSDAPSTHYRAIWYSDDDFNRRNRLGGFRIEANHALEGYISAKQREENPEWRAVISGEPHRSRLKWSHPGVAEAIADAIIAKLDKEYVPSISLSPDDGAAFDESDDRALDAGDWDQTMNQASITDRYIVLCNRIAERVTKKYPDVLLGFYAYVQYTRPPVREKLHPNLVPVIAPINYCRAHSFMDDHCTSRQEIRTILEGWSKVAPEIGYYNYMFHLAEVSAPYPMIRQMSQEVPFVYQHRVKYWQPETLSNFEEVLPGMWLTLRLAWNNKIEPEAALSEFYTLYYGAAAEPMRTYWEGMDRAWNEKPYHAGSLWSYNQRFTPDVLKAGREQIDLALEKASTPMEYQRVEIQHRALLQFERLMAMRQRINSGDYAHLDLKVTEWVGNQLALGEEYEKERAFSKVAWTRWTVAGEYFRVFMRETCEDAARKTREMTRLTPPITKWRYQLIRDSGDVKKKHNGLEEGMQAGWHQPGFDDSQWKITDVGVETWADLGFGEALGTVWYRASLPATIRRDGKRTLLWISSYDGKTRVFVNGKAAPLADDSQGYEGDLYANPTSFDITSLLEGEKFEVAISSSRWFLNELGTGGLLGPVVIFGDK